MTKFEAEVIRIVAIGGRSMGLDSEKKVRKAEETLISVSFYGFELVDRSEEFGTSFYVQIRPTK